MKLGIRMNQAINTYTDKPYLRQTPWDDKRIFTCIFTRHYQRIYNYVQHYFTHCPATAADITQEVFIRLWQHRQRIASVEHLSPYIIALAHNQSINYLKKYNRMLKGRKAYTSTFTGSITEVEEKLFAREMADAWQVAIGGLPPRQRGVYMLSEQGYCNKEIAESFCVSEHTVREQKRRANRQVRNAVRRKLDLEAEIRQEAA